MTLAPPRAGTLQPDKRQPEATRPWVLTSRWMWALGVIVLWVVIWSVTKGNDTLAIAGRERTGVQDALAEFRDSVIASRDDNPIIQLTYEIGGWLNSVVDWLQRMVSIENFPRPVPEIGWLGVTAVVTWVGLAVAGWRIALLVALSFLSFGIFGYWSDAIDLLVVTFVAVGVSVLIGMPLAVLMGTGNRVVLAVMNTILDVFQTIPTFVFLAPIALFFGIGASGAVVATLLYALPPIIRVAGHGIRSVSPTTIEATDSAGQTRWQRLIKVQLPMARRTIVVGLNQTTLAALSMATIAAFIDGPGLGQPVLDFLKTVNVGGAFVPGALIVVTAVMLDRTTTAASEYGERAARGGVDLKRRRIVLAAAAVPVLVALYLSRTYPWAAEFSDSTWGPRLADAVNDFFGWFTDAFRDLTQGFKDTISAILLNPLESLLADSPWWLTAGALLLLAYVLGGIRAALPTLICVGALLYFGLWNHAMITLTMTLVGTVLVMILALVLGVSMARSSKTDLALRPLLDAGQTIPPFVYLIPVLALFGPTRFTAIVAGVVYAAPVAIKLVADGVKAVSPTTLEATRSAGSTTWQEITKVQLPMARGSLVLAANQGLLYVLAMAVIGGLVGAGGLGYDVVLGFARSEEWGFGAAAGISIVLLGIMVDRIARGAAQKAAQ
jgi:glycine betaine/proline transport system permease protein